MFDPGQLPGYLAAVLLLVLIPGPNTMIILAHSIGGGRRAGLATMIHTMAAALGLSAVLTASPVAFSVVKLACIAYLAIIGVRALLQPPPQLSESAGERLTGLVALRRALLTNLLNPKVALFFLAFLPQFARPECGHLALQLVALGLIVSAVNIPVGSALAIGAGSLAQWLRRNVAFAQWQQRIIGYAMIGLAVRLAVV